MTQALLNNLNIIQEGKFDLKDKVGINSGANFSKIFDCANKLQDKYKYNKQTDHTKDTYNSIPLQPQTENKIVTAEVDTNNALSNEESGKENLVSKLTNENDTDNKDNSTDSANLCEVILKAAIETITEEVLTEDEVNTQSQNLIQDNETDETITENNINEEAPTMYKELNTLENPAVTLLLQSQIKMPKQVLAENESSNEIQNNEKEISLNNQTVNSNAKQFDSNIIKNMPSTYSAKEDTDIKAEAQKAKTSIEDKVVKDLKLEIVESETAASDFGSENFMQNTSPQEQVVKVMIQGDVKSANAFESIVKPEMQKTDVASPSKIIEQISKQLENLNNGSKLTMILNPESLGKINIQLLNTKAGLMAQFTVSTQEAKDMLMRGLEGLKGNLLSQGIAVDSVNIKLEEAFLSEDNSSDWTEQEGSRGGNKQQGNKHQNDEKEQQFEQFMFDYSNGNV